MITYREWFEVKDGKTFASCDSWFLFGFIPVYVRRHLNFPVAL